MIPTCPRCGQELAIPDHALVDAQTAPWLCSSCNLGFWCAELTDAARRAYRPLDHHWGRDEAGQQVRSAVEAERADARARGTSVQGAHLALLGDAQLTLLSSRARRAPGFVASVDQEVARRRGGRR